jgi:TorA maturation chaperone TorD
MTDAKNCEITGANDTKTGSDTEIGEVQELIELTKQRASTYQFLSHLYRKEVDEDFLNQMKALRFPLNTGNDDIDKGYRLLAAYLSTVWENSLTDLAVDYSRTFIGHGIDAFSASYPYESVYTSKKRLLMQEARDEVLAIYRSVGLDKKDSWREGEDHIALELEFEEILCGRIVEALEKNDEETAYSLLLLQKDFLFDHLVAWVPMFTADMLRFAKTDFYLGLAYLTQGFLRMDLAFLQELLSSEDE